MYIRTKYGVYKVSHYNDWATHKRKGATLIDGDKTSYIKNEDIIAQSENLEELCDEFVMTHYFKETNYTKCEVLKEDKDLMIKAVRLKKQHNKDKELKNEFNIYGAIWTNKGLIYVAKLNDKGELELICQK